MPPTRAPRGQSPKQVQSFERIRVNQGLKDSLFPKVEKAKTPVKSEGAPKKRETSSPKSRPVRKR